MNITKRLARAMQVTAIATISLGLPTIAQASDWYIGATSSDDDRYFIDRQSIVRNGSIAKVNILNVFKNPDDDVVASNLIDEYDCTQSKARTIEMTLLYENGSSKKLQSNSNTEWKYYAPGSVGSGLIKQVCGY